MHCPSCGAPTRSASPSCRYCGVESAGTLPPMYHVTVDPGHEADITAVEDAWNEALERRVDFITPPWVKVSVITDPRTVPLDRILI